MLLQQSRLDEIVKVLHECLSPQSERLCIVTANILDMLDNETTSRLFADMLQYLGDGWQETAREDVVIDEARRLRLVSIDGAIN